MKGCAGRCFQATIISPYYKGPTVFSLLCFIYKGERQSRVVFLASLCTEPLVPQLETTITLWPGSSPELHSQIAVLPLKAGTQPITLRVMMQAIPPGAYCVKHPLRIYSSEAGIQHGGQGGGGMEEPPGLDLELTVLILNFTLLVQTSAA